MPEGSLGYWVRFQSATRFKIKRRCHRLTRAANERPHSLRQTDVRNPSAYATGRARETNYAHRAVRVAMPNETTVRSATRYAAGILVTGLSSLIRSGHKELGATEGSTTAGGGSRLCLPPAGLARANLPSSSRASIGTAHNPPRARVADEPKRLVAPRASDTPWHRVQVS